MHIIGSTWALLSVNVVRTSASRSLFDHSRNIYVRKMNTFQLERDDSLDSVHAYSLFRFLHTFCLFYVTLAVEMLIYVKYVPTIRNLLIKYSVTIYIAVRVEVEGGESSNEILEK